MMRKFLLLVAMLALIASSVSASTWSVDAAHTTVSFKVSHLVISKVTGKFGQFSGSMEFDGKDISTGSVTLNVDINSVDTENEDRDKHLTSADFFDAEKHPEMSFKSTKVEKGSGKNFKLIGDLTIKGITKSVTFDSEFHGAVAFMGTNKSGFTAVTTINRQDFGLTWSKALETGGLIVGDEVEIELELEFNEAKAEADSGK